jgi:hypothetical protein
MSGPKVVIDRLACLLSDLEPLRPTCFLVSGRLADRTSVRCGILDSEAHHIATSKLAVADKIEEHECSYSSSKLQPSTNGRTFFGCSGGCGPIRRPLFQGRRAGAVMVEEFVISVVVSFIRPKKTSVYPM